MDNIYRQLVKNKPKVDNLAHGIQLDEFRQALLRICIICERQFIEYKQAYADWAGKRKALPAVQSWSARYKHGDSNGKADGNKVAAFDGLMAYLNIPAGKYGNAGSYDSTRPFIRDRETDVRFKEIAEKRRKLFPPRKIKAGKSNFTPSIE